MPGQSSFVRHAWYIAGWSHELRRKPLPRRFLGSHVVLFRGADGTAHAVGAACPHRGADLGRGRVVDGTLECPFHGWRFDPSGRCVRVPSQPADLKIPPGARVPTYPLREQQGFLWIWPDSEVPPDAPPPSYDFFDDPRIVRVPDQSFLVSAPFVCVVENAIDNSHPHFIHPKSLPGEAAVVERQLVETDSDDRGFRAQFDPDSPWKSEDAGRRGWFEVLRPFQRLTDRHVEDSYFRFDLGGVVFFYDSFAPRGYHVGFAGITPADATHTWFFAELARTYWRTPVVSWVLRIWMNWLNREDVDHSERLLVADRDGGHPSPVSVVADVPALKFRQVYDNSLMRARAGEPRSRAESHGADSGSIASAADG